MKTFKQFIKEQNTPTNSTSTEADIIFHKILGSLDTGHIDYAGDVVTIDIGDLIDDTTVDLQLVIMHSNTHFIKAATDTTTQKKSIVIGTTGQLPKRKQIDRYLSTNRTRAEQVTALIAEYLKTSDRHPSEKGTKVESQNELNNPEKFENMYEATIEKLKNEIEDYNGSIAEIKNQMEHGDAGVRITAKHAMKHLFDETFGESDDEFKKIFKKLMHDIPNGDKLLSKENKLRLDKRLNSVYRTTIQNLKPQE